MKYTYPLFLLFLLSFCLTAQRGAPARVNQKWLAGQDSLTQKQSAYDAGKERPTPGRGVSLHLMPFSLVNSLPRLRAGAQYKRDRWSFLLDLEYGRSFDGGDDPAGFQSNYLFYGARPEVRMTVRPGSQVYYGLELPVTFMSRNLEGVFRRQTEGRLPVAEAFQERFRISGIAKIGTQFLVFKHLLFDVYAGLGAGHQNVQYTNLGVYPVTPVNESLFDPISELPSPNNSIIAEAAFGVRVGWWFNTNRRNE